MRAHRYPALVTLLFVVLMPAGVAAFDSLFSRIKADASLAQIFPDGTARADIQEGMLIGTGSEQLQHRPDGRLNVTRTRHYTSLRRPDTKQVAKLPEPWEASTSMLLEPNLRLVQAETKIRFKQAQGDALFPDYKLSEEHKWLFEADRSVIKAVEGGKKLSMQMYRQGKPVKQSTFDYPADSAPIELVGLLLSAAVARGVDKFDFQLLVPGDGTHGIRAQVHRTRDVAKFAQGYRVPKGRLKTAEALAVLDMRLASPVKYLFYPHHFFMAFSIEHPDRLMMMWGGDADTNLQAFRQP
jgi:hypothetical protein